MSTTDLSGRLSFTTNTRGLKVIVLADNFYTKESCLFFQKKRDKRYTDRKQCFAVVQKRQKKKNVAFFVTIEKNAGVVVDFLKVPVFQ